MTMRKRFLMVTVLLLVETCLTGVNGDCDPRVVETDSRLAERTQQQNLHTLFLKYGENGTISLAGLQRLLEGLGLDRIRRVTVQHHGGKHEHEHAHSHAHSPKHAQKHTAGMHSVGGKKEEDGSTVEKITSTFSDNPDSISVKKSQLDIHHNLYIKRDSDSTAVLTTPSYVSKSRRSERSSDHNLMESGVSQPNTANPTNTYQTESTSPRNPDDHNHHDEKQSLLHYNASQECQNATMILQTHGMSQESTLSINDFSFLCPALLVQVDFKSCLVHDEKESKDHFHHHHHDEATEKSPRSYSIYMALIGGFLSITIISLLALAGGVLIPLINKVCFNFLLSFLVALAVGTLSGDALLHLIPHSQGHPEHQHAANESLEHDLHDNTEESLKPVWTGLTALGGVYIMFLIEHFLTLAKMFKDKKHKVQKRAEFSAETLNSQNVSVTADPNVKPPDDSEVNGRHAWGQGLPEEEEVMLSEGCYTDEDCENKCHSHFHDTVGQSDEQHHHHHNYHHILHHHHSQNHHPHTHTHRHTHLFSVQYFENAGIATLAWLVIMGDGLHNFSGGLAIGVTFTDGLAGGLSTSVAVFCHELLHKLGDFAVLLKAGMSLKQAILYNLLSAVMGYLGMVIGILIGHYADNVAMWIFALTAGLFMYVALVDMVPEMLHNDASEAGFSHYGFFVLQNVGILLGFGIMLLIAMFEHKIQFSVDL